MPVMLILSRQNQKSVASWKTRWQGTRVSTVAICIVAGPNLDPAPEALHPRAYLGQRRGAPWGVPGRLEAELHIGRSGILRLTVFLRLDSRIRGISAVLKLESLEWAGSESAAGRGEPREGQHGPAPSRPCTGVGGREAPAPKGRATGSLREKPSSGQGPKGAEINLPVKQPQISPGAPAQAPSS